MGTVTGVVLVTVACPGAALSLRAERSIHRTFWDTFHGRDRRFRRGAHVDRRGCAAQCGRDDFKFRPDRSLGLLMTQRSGLLQTGPQPPKEVV